MDQGPDIYKTLPSISVIVPNYNNNQELAKCLRHLNKQTYPGRLLETIVVDNGSSQSISAIMLQFPNVIFDTVTSPKSPYICRNQGIRRSTGEILAFTDSNSYSDHNWIMNAVKTMLDKNYDIVAGDIIFEVNEALTTADKLEMLLFPDLEQISNSGRTATAKNLFVKRSIFKKIGLFIQVRSNGDSEFVNRAVEHKVSFGTAKDSIVYYKAPSLKKVLRKQFRIGRGNAEVKFHQYSAGYFEWICKTILGMRPPSIKYVRMLIETKSRNYRITYSATLHFFIWLTRLCKGLGRLTLIPFRKP